MHFKVLLIVLLVTLVDNTDGKKKGKKKPASQSPTCKKTDIEKLVTQLNDLRTDTQSCCVRSEEDAALHVSLIEIKNNVTKARTTIEEVKTDVEEMKNDVKVKQDIEEMKNDIEVMKNDVKVKQDIEAMKNDIEVMKNDVKVKQDIEEMKNDIEKMKNDSSVMKDLLEKMHNSQCESAVTNPPRSETTELQQQSNTTVTIPPQSETTEMHQTTEATANHPIDCSDNTGFTGVTTIQPEGQNSIQVYCSAGCVYIARRFDGSVDFYKGWAEYQAGFGSADGEYFVGLDNLHSLLARRNYRLRIELTPWPPQNETRHAEYSIFNVGDASDNYQLTIDGYSGDAGNSLASHNGMPFTTKDRDNDPNSDNCAIRFKGAGWYTSGCHHTNLFGFYSSGPVCPGHAQCMSWYHLFENHSHSLKKLDMKICPILE